MTEQKTDSQEQATKSRITRAKELILAVAADSVSGAPTAETIQILEGNEIVLQVVGPATILIVRHRDAEVKR